MAIAQTASGVFTALITHLDGLVDAGLVAQKAHRAEGTPEDAITLGRLQRGQHPALVVFPVDAAEEEATLSGLEGANYLTTAIDITVLNTLENYRDPDEADAHSKVLDDLADEVFVSLNSISASAVLALNSGTRIRVQGIRPLSDLGRFDWAGRAVRVVVQRPCHDTSA